MAAFASRGPIAAAASYTVAPSSSSSGEPSGRVTRRVMRCPFLSVARPHTCAGAVDRLSLADGHDRGAGLALERARSPIAAIMPPPRSSEVVRPRRCMFRAKVVVPVRRQAREEGRHESTEKTRPTLAEIGRAGGTAGRSDGCAGWRRQAGCSRPSTSDERTDAWHRTWQWIVAAAIASALAWFTYAREGWVPILSYFDLGVHEFGHLLTIWAPDLVVWPAGSFLQVAAPLAGVLLPVPPGPLRGDPDGRLGGRVAQQRLCLRRDAQAMVLPLFGDDGSGAGHDWHNILAGSTCWIRPTPSRALPVASVLLFVAALGLAAWWFLGAAGATESQAPARPRAGRDQPRRPPSARRLMPLNITLTLTQSPSPPALRLRQG